MTGEAIYWRGTEDQQHAERIKACRARRKAYPELGCADMDGSCSECSYDMAMALRISEQEYMRRLNNGEVDDHD